MRLFESKVPALHGAGLYGLSCIRSNKVFEEFRANYPPRKTPWDCAGWIELFRRVGGKEARLILWDMLVLDLEVNGRAVVDALMDIVPAETRGEMLLEIWNRPLVPHDRRVYALCNLIELGERPVDAIRTALLSDSAGKVMWELSRETAPGTIASPPTALLPLKESAPIPACLERFGRKVLVEDPVVTKPIRRPFSRERLDELLTRVANEHQMGFVLKDEEIRIVPKPKAVEFYLDLIAKRAK
jgi:hypothetical protein